jgi:hypothetical protein
VTSELIGLLANLALTLSLIVAVVFGIAQAQAAARDRRERLTLETLRRFESREFAELIQYIDTHDLPSNRKALRELPVNEQAMFIQFSMQMEDLGILVAEDMINIDLVDKTLGSFVSAAWAKYREMTMNTRAEDNEPFMSEYFQWLAETIDARMRANPRKPFHESHPPAVPGHKK